MYERIESTNPRTSAKIIKALCITSGSIDFNSEH